MLSQTLALATGSRVVSFYVTCTSGLRRWAAKAGLAILDQGLISGSNFIVSIVLARWLAPAQYGIYALTFSIFLLLGGLHQALLLAPMSVFGGSVYANRLKEYLRTLLRFHGVIVALAIIPALSLTALLARSSIPKGALASLAVAAPCVFLFWMVRRALYIQRSPGSAVIGALLYCLIVLCGLFVVHHKGLLSPFSAFVLFAFGALMASSLLLIRMKPPVIMQSNIPSLNTVWHQHWDYGRWALATSIVGWAMDNTLYVLTGAFLSLADVGALKALLNIGLPVVHSSVAFSLIFQPHVSGVHAKHGVTATRVSIQKLTLLFVGGGIAYWALVTTFRVPLFHILYGSRFSEWMNLVPWATSITVFWAGAHAANIGLGAMRSPSSILIVSSTSGAAVLLLGIPAIRLFGLPGAIGALVLQSVVGLVVANFLFYRRVRKTRALAG